VPGGCKQALEMASHVFCDLGTGSIKMWAPGPPFLYTRVTLPTSPSARYCTLFKVWGCRLLKQWAEPKIGNSRDARVTAVPTLMHSILFYSIPLIL
jgi:hypothetical protein